jgi:hypothetical protein
MKGKYGGRGGGERRDDEVIKYELEVELVVVVVLLLLLHTYIVLLLVKLCTPNDPYWNEEGATQVPSLTQHVTSRRRSGADCDPPNCPVGVQFVPNSVKILPLSSVFILFALHYLQ